MPGNVDLSYNFKPDLHWEPICSNLSQQVPHLDHKLLTFLEYTDHEDENEDGEEGTGEEEEDNDEGDDDDDDEEEEDNQKRYEFRQRKAVVRYQAPLEGQYSEAPLGWAISR